VLTTAGADVLDDELPIGNAYEAFDDKLRLADRELTTRLEHILVNLVARAIPHRPSSARRALMCPTPNPTLPDHPGPDIPSARFWNSTKGDSR
jgi:hypothetical protein